MRTTNLLKTPSIFKFAVCTFSTLRMMILWMEITAGLQILWHRTSIHEQQLANFLLLLCLIPLPQVLLFIRFRELSEIISPLFLSRVLALLLMFNQKRPRTLPIFSTKYAVMTSVCSVMSYRVSPRDRARTLRDYARKFEAKMLDHDMISQALDVILFRVRTARFRTFATPR